MCRIFMCMYVLVFVVVCRGMYGCNSSGDGWYVKREWGSFRKWERENVGGSANDVSKYM